MNIQKEFSNNATSYNSNNIIQNSVIEELIKMVDDKPSTILDIGCGRGGLFENINWTLNKFVGLDFAQGMIDLHPKSNIVDLHVKDFNTNNCFDDIKHITFSRVVSASALQWSKDLNNTFKQIKSLNAPVTLAIFTSNTFKTLYEVASLPPLLRSKEEIIETSKKYFNAEYKVLNYELKFSSIREMFKYMKKSGVGGARNILTISDMRKIMKNYPYDFLEYEIILIHEKK